MAAKRGRNITSFGQAFTPMFIDGTPGPGQPTRLRTWGIPTGPGWFDRPGKWNIVIPPIVIGALELARRIMGHIRA